MAKKNKTVTNTTLAEQVVSLLDLLKIAKPNTQITVETPNGTSTCKLSDALIYVNDDYDIIVDSE